MENNEFLSASEKLTAFLDGELDASESGSLFYEIAQNPDLQEEMKDLVQIRNSFRNAQIAPPPEMKNKIMAGVGLAVPIANAGRVAFGVMLMSFFKKNYVSIMLGIALLSIGYYSFRSNSNLTENVENNSYPLISTESITQDQSIRNKRETGVNNNTNINIPPVIADPTDKIVESNKKSSSNQSIINDENRKIENTFDEINSVKSTIHGNINPSQIANYNNHSINLSPDFTSLNSGLKMNLGNILSNISLQLRISNGKSYPNPEIAGNNAFVNDFSISLMYGLNENNSLGIEFGRESFMMEFQGYEGDILYLYPQRYNAFNWGAFYQYRFNQLQIAESLTPFARIYFGGTNVGPMSRISIGTNYILTHNVSLNAGFDYTALLYSHLGNYFNTNKISWSIGLSLGL